MEHPVTTASGGPSPGDDATDVAHVGWRQAAPGALAALLEWVEQGSEPVVALDRAGRILIANPAFARAFAIVPRPMPTSLEPVPLDPSVPLARFVPLLSPPRLARWLDESASGAARMHRLLAEAVGADGDRFLVAATLLKVGVETHVTGPERVEAPACVVALRPLDASRGLALRVGTARAPAVAGVAAAAAATAAAVADAAGTEAAEFPDAVALGPLLDAACRGAASAEARRRIRRRPHDPAARVAGDADAVREALARLIDNAIRYAPGDTPVTLRTRRERCEPSGAPHGADSVGHIVITVADRGRGFTRSQLQRAFEPFARGDASGGGPGLGLAIARHLVEAQAGWIELRSDAGIGTEAEIWLPEAD
ncbi:MAG: hypothetical protein EHM87_07465 [Burkholderiales bacterium]|nr:MAG: hypothetical protein EHM87_07465 [Burkholderiales bacterium]